MQLPFYYSMSLDVRNGFQALDDAVRAVIKQGIHVATSAGNYWANACTVSPARVSEAYVVYHLHCRF